MYNTIQYNTGISNAINLASQEREMKTADQSLRNYIIVILCYYQRNCCQCKVQQSFL